MPLIKVTATGPDDTTHILSLFELLRKYPRAEIGVLVSPHLSGRSRFPSSVWLDRLHEAVGLNYGLRGRFSLHACGGYVRDFLNCNGSLLLALLKRYDRTYSRVQINTHGETILKDRPEGVDAHTHLSSALLSIEANLKVLADMDIEVIFQRDGVNDFIFDLLCERGRAQNISTLFDLSAGAGILPSEWPNPIEGQRFGYAGGLSPDNVVDNLLLIEAKCSQNFWIDAEGRLMADDGHMNLTTVEEYFRRAGA